MLIDKLHKITSKYPSSSNIHAWALENIIFRSPWKPSSDCVFEKSLKLVKPEIIEGLCKENLIYKDEAGEVRANFSIIEKKLNEKGMSLRENIGEHAYKNHL